MTENLKKPVKYSCAECGVATIVHEGVIIRPCDHKEAGVLASMSAHAYGKSHFLRQNKSSL